MQEHPGNFSVDRNLRPDVLEEREVSALLRPVDWNLSVHQVGQRELSQLAAVDDGTSDIESEISKSDHTADVRPRAAVFASRFVQRPSLLQPPAQATSPGQRLDERSFNARQPTQMVPTSVRCGRL